MKEMIRPKVIREAAELLCNTPLYKEEGITLNDNYDNMEGKTKKKLKTVKILEKNLKTKLRF